MQRTRARVAGRVLLVGDAAGYVDALTGEGIAIALTTAAELVSCLAAGNPAGYEAAWRRASRRTRLLTSGLLWARQHTPLERIVVPLASRIPPLFTATVNALAN
jgi:flavin-dependent dehydrogenase